MSDAIRFEGVRRTFGRVVAVDRIDLRIGAGEFVGLVGHNGAGKSTTLEMLMGLLDPTEGRILVDGVDVQKEPVAARQRLGCVPEEPPLYEWLTAREMLAFVRDVRGGGDLARALDVADLGDDADRPIREYSQGMRRRTALAAATLGAPKVLVLDEALNGLDPPSAAKTKAWLRTWVDAGGTVVLSTHALEVVQKVTDRVVMLAHGRVVADERTADLGDQGLEALFLEKLTK